MEAVPRLPMLNFDLKTSPENPDFDNKFKQLIAQLGEDPSGFEKEIREFGTLRASSCIRPSVSVEGAATAKKYYCQLLFLKNRFKIGSDSPFQFSWKDIYSNVKYSTSDINHELASVLYNIGALHSRLGSEEDRQARDETLVWRLIGHLISVLRSHWMIQTPDTCLIPGLRRVTG